MEVCGTHTVAIARHGLRARLDRGVRLVSGPGCPLCVTGTSVQVRAARLTRTPGLTLFSFPDLLRPPLPLAGTPARAVLSVGQALDHALRNPRRLVVFLAIGFETTAATIAAALRRARAREVSNFRVLSATRTLAPALLALLGSGRPSLDGLLCPGHVSVITGLAPYRPVVARGVPAVVAGFEGHDLKLGLAVLVGLARRREARLVNAYPRAVRNAGNPTALAALEEVFRPAPVYWRGLGEIAGSGLALAPDYREFDADGLVDPLPERDDEADGCQCGAVLRGVLAPRECRAFGNACVPTSPLGPCMISAEGACAAAYRYERVGA
jgi:hydrogenase expression/formation protein HypD